MKQTVYYMAFAFILGVLVDAVRAEQQQSEREHVIVDFTRKGDFSGWNIQDDVVMGGRSKGAFAVSEDGYGVFSGDVSLENNGGFSSVQYEFEPVDATEHRKAVLRVKGDGKRYQFRVVSDHSIRHAYIYYFETTGEWQDVEVPFDEMYPSWRGNRLNLPNYPGKTIAQVRFLIANDRAETFRLEIERIVLR
jgi:hypothetical protein